jgi:hypothetical protein
MQHEEYVEPIFICITIIPNDYSEILTGSVIIHDKLLDHRGTVIDCIHSFTCNDSKSLALQINQYV